MTRRDSEYIFLQRSEAKPGKWVNHSRLAAHAAELIAGQCGMDLEEAYSMGLLHDIGRSFTDGQFQHITYGYRFMSEMKADDIARICLTHSFPIQDILTYVGQFDVSGEELERYSALLTSLRYNDYDRLIQLCDAFSGTEGYVTIEERTQGLIRKYGPKPFMKERKEVLDRIEMDFRNKGFVGPAALLPEKYHFKK